MFVLNNVGTDGSHFQNNVMITTLFQETDAQIVFEILAILVTQQEEEQALVIQFVMIR